MPLEKWRTIPDFPNYVISDQGRVANKAGNLKTISKLNCVTLNRDGYQAKKSIKSLMKVWNERKPV